MSVRTTLRTVALGAIVAGAAVGCGQRGPLVLPDDARPIERLPQPPPQSAEPQSDEEERRNER